MRNRWVPTREDRVVRDEKGEIPFQVVRKTSRKRVMVKVAPSGVVEVRTPVSVTGEEADDIVLANAERVREMMNCVQSTAPAATRYKTGQKIPYMGGELPLQIAHGPQTEPMAGLVDGYLRVTIPSEMDEDDRHVAVRIALINWLGQRTLDYIREHFSDLSDRLGLYAAKVTVKQMTSRWGSCSSAGRISVNARLTMAPVDVINYVLVHELCHLAHPNHSPDFWAMMEKAMPDYKTHRRWLKENSLRLSL